MQTIHKKPIVAIIMSGISAILLPILCFVLPVKPDSLVYEHEWLSYLMAAIFFIFYALLTIIMCKR